VRFNMMQVVAVPLLLRHCVPRGTAGEIKLVAPRLGQLGGSPPTEAEAVLGGQGKLLSALQSPSLEQGLSAELLRLAGPSATVRRVARALASMPRQCPAGMPAQQWYAVWHSAAKLLAIVCYNSREATAFSGSTGGSSSGRGSRSGRGSVGSSSDLQVAAFEALAAVPALAALLREGLAAEARGDRGLFPEADSVDVQMNALRQAVVLLEAAAPQQLPGAQHVAPWAAAVDAALRLLPALNERRGGAPAALCGPIVELLWNNGCSLVFAWAMRGASAAAEHQAAWADAAQPLFAAHARACRLVHWLRAQPDGGTAMLAKLMPDEQARSRWRLMHKLQLLHAKLCRWAMQAVEAAQSPFR
jgi:hypothetical protein